MMMMMMTAIQLPHIPTQRCCRHRHRRRTV